jgi:hypothetical protein
VEVRDIDTQRMMIRVERGKGGGTAPVTVSSVTLNGTGFTMSGAFPVTLNPGLAVTLDVQFDPAAAGAATGR